MSNGRTAGIYDFDNIRTHIDRIRKEESVINPGGPNNVGTVSGIDTSIPEPEASDQYPPSYY